MGGRITETIHNDQLAIQGCYNRIINSANRDEQIRYQNLLTWELARYLVGEELVVYPAFEKYVTGGAQILKRNRVENQRVKEKLKQFQNLDPSHSEFIPSIEGLMGDLSRHTQEQENDLAQLDEALSAEGSEKLSKSFERTKIFVPSRSHPGVHKTVGELLTAPFDQLGDLFRKWPQHA
ncbi:hypothetical protein BBP40_008495 [Aspergillus hancockii]|nr:hypothetical protein BBP40_008495 [Aspergillus hancockii]